MGDKPAFIIRKFENAQKLAARGYSCPLCLDTFHTEPKLWEHAKSRHQQKLGFTDSGAEGEARKKFRHEAVGKAHDTSRRVVRDTQPPVSKPSSNDNDSMRPNIGEDVRSRSPLRSSTGPLPMEKRIHDISKLTLEQDRTPNPLLEAEQPDPPSSNPLKRGAAAHTGVSELPMEDEPSRHVKSRARKAKTQSASSIGRKGADHNRDQPVGNDPNFVRKTIGSGKKLFDPERDSPVSSPAARKNRLSDYARMDNRDDDPRPHMVYPREAQFVDMRGSRSKHQHRPRAAENSNPPDIEIGEDSPERMDHDSGSSEPHGQDIEPDQELELLEPVLLLQPETRPISHDQLVVEVKGIYAGLVMVESKCADVDEKQSKAAQEQDPSRRKGLSNEQWQALIHLHKTLLHEHHDFFLASQHPSASPALSRLAAKYSMPARMWRHGIHSFLEVLRHMLPGSLDHMLAFVYIAYSMMALLYETVPAFEDTWIECLGDLARYRMAIEDDDIRDREIWTGTARSWYSKAADKNPETGRLYHHLAILARPFTLQQLSYYARSLTCVVPFENARGSIMTLFNPILSNKSSAHYRPDTLETIFIKCHGVLFCNHPREQFEAIVAQIRSSLLDNYIGRVGSKFKEEGVFATLANIAALFEYGALRTNGQPKSILRLAYDEIRHRNYTRVRTKSQHSDEISLDLNGSEYSSSPPPLHSLVDSLTSAELRSSLVSVSQASKLTFSTLEISLRRIGDRNVFPLVHVSLVFLRSLATIDRAMKYVEQDIPWVEICSFLTALAKSETMTDKVLAPVFPKPDNGIGRPLPEDFAMRGLPYTDGYFPEGRFSDAAVDDEERSLELPSMAAPRVERILCLGIQIASLNRWIFYDSTVNTFNITDYAKGILSAPEQTLEDRMNISVSSVDDKHMSEAGPLANEAEQPSESPSREDIDASTSAAELQRLRDKRQYDVEPLSPARDESIIPTKKADDPHTASWLDHPVLDKSKNSPHKPPSEQLKSDPHKLSLIYKFDEGTGIDPTKS